MVDWPSRYREEGTKMNLPDMLELFFVNRRLRFIRNEIIRETSRMEHCRICIEGDKALLQDPLGQQLQLEGGLRTI